VLSLLPDPTLHLTMLPLPLPLLLLRLAQRLAHPLVARTQVAVGTLGAVVPDGVTDTAPLAYVPAAAQLPGLQCRLWAELLGCQAGAQLAELC